MMVGKAGLNVNHVTTGPQQLAVALGGERPQVRQLLFRRPRKIAQIGYGACSGSRPRTPGLEPRREERAGG